MDALCAAGSAACPERYIFDWTYYWNHSEFRGGSSFWINGTDAYILQRSADKAGHAAVVCTVSICICLGFFCDRVTGVILCAVIVMQGKTKGGFMRIVQLPIVVPHVVVALFIVNIFSQNGLLARMAFALGIIGDQQDFPVIVYNANGMGVILAYLWKEIPFIIYFVIALMANINGNLGEAAVNLGAGRIQSFCRVTLPLCAHTILSGFLIIFVFALGAYELPVLLGATAPKALPVLAYIQYTHPDLRNRPYARR